MIPVYEHRITFNDTDEYGHFNNDKINQHFEISRRNFFDHLGIGAQDMTRQGLLFVVADLHTQYKSEAFPAEVIQVSARMEQYRQTGFYVFEEMETEGRVVAVQRTSNMFKRAMPRGQNKLTMPPRDLIARLSEQPEDVVRLL